MKVFIDANIVLDLLLQRRFFYLNAEKSLLYRIEVG